MPDVIVVGGGVVGAASAWALARSGAAVTLVERDELAAGASGRNQGWLVEPDDPVNEPLFAPSTATYLEAAERAPLPVWIDPEDVGHLRVALDGDGEVPEELVRSAEVLDRRALRDLEPELAPTASRGWLTSGGRRVDPAALTVAMGLLAAVAGASIRHHLSVRALAVENDRVRGVVTDEGRHDADLVVVAAGPWSTSLLDPIGVRLPVRPARGWIVRLGPETPPIHRLVERAGWRASEWRHDVALAPEAGAFADAGVTTAGGALLNPHPDGTLLVGSSREPAVTPEPGDPSVPRRQVAEAIELIPSLARVEVRSSWWGVRPLSPDDRPLIGIVRDGLVVATGHGSEGVITAGGTAQLVAALALGQPPPFDPTPWDPRRFEQPSVRAPGR